jgi:hypothetical protein
VREDKEMTIQNYIEKTRVDLNRFQRYVAKNPDFVAENVSEDEWDEAFQDYKILDATQMDV